MSVKKIVKNIRWVGVIAALCAGTAHADNFPSKSIKIVAPYLAGGTVDSLARKLAPHFSQALGQSVVVENKAGASGNIGASAVAAAKGDAHTLLLTASTIVSNPLVVSGQPSFSLKEDLVPIGQVASTPLVLVVAHNSEIDSTKKLIQVAKTTPEIVNFGVGAFGSGGHLAMEYFNVEAGTQIPMVIYKGSAQALADIASGQVTAMLDPIGAALPLIEGGRLKALAVTGDARHALLPQTPTLKELGLEQVNQFMSWYGLWAPKGVSQADRSKLEVTLQQALQTEEIKQWLAANGLNAGVAKGTAFEKLIDEDYAISKQTVDRAGIRKQ